MTFTNSIDQLNYRKDSQLKDENTKYLKDYYIPKKGPSTLNLPIDFLKNQFE
jgi:hypothetical protein